MRCGGALGLLMAIHMGAPTVVASMKIALDFLPSKSKSFKGHY